ncbi:hypothetical protein ACWEQL_23095 [Kitasatospora sp. NPDC004240]
MASQVARASAVLVLGATLGACTAGVDAPLPPPLPSTVKSPEEAEKWANQLHDHVLQAAGGPTRNPWVGHISAKYRCPGLGHGIAEPGEPYQFTSLTSLEVPDGQRVEMTRRVRDALAGEGLRISEYEESTAGSPSAAPTIEFRADHPGEHYVVGLSSTKPGEGVSITVTLPCLQPPSSPGTSSPSPSVTAPAA